MRLKFPGDVPHGGWAFYLKVRGKEVKLQSHSLALLTESVRKTLASNQLDVPSPEDLRTIIEHQICLRQPDPVEACFSSGIGDDLHHRFVVPVIDWLQRNVSKTVGRRLQALDSAKGCAGCKGTTVYDPSKGIANTGRAGALNTVFMPERP